MKKEPSPAGADGSSSLMWPPCSCQCCPGPGHSGLGRGSLPPRESGLGIQAKRCPCWSKRGNSSGNSSLSSWEPSCWEAALSRRVDSQVSLSSSMSWGPGRDPGVQLEGLIAGLGGDPDPLLSPAAVLGWGSWACLTWRRLRGDHICPSEDGPGSALQGPGIGQETTGRN